MKSVCILGASGSIGQSTLDVLARHPERYCLHSVTGHTQVEKMADICRKYHPRVAVMADEASAKKLKTILPGDLGIQVEGGEQALVDVAADAETDIVMAAIVGAVGLIPTLSAVRSGKRVLLANKEALVMAGHLFMREVKTCQAELLPIDSEHNAIFQCLPPDYPEGITKKGVSKILLTGSGGPFRSLPLDQFANITPEQAIAHPNWNMGPKISVDSATMMNKGLELIEACWLFDVPPQDVEIVLHPQSIIHSMVAYNDGSVLAQMGQPDMRTPIANALGWPERIHSGVEPLDLVKVTQLNFEQADEKRFPCLRLARWAVHQGGTSMTILNAANEIAVEAFLNNQIAFTRIAELIENTLNRVESRHTDDLQEILLDDQRARKMTRQLINQM